MPRGLGRYFEGHEHLTEAPATWVKSAEYTPSRTCNLQPASTPPLISPLPSPSQPSRALHLAGPAAGRPSCPALPLLGPLGPRLLPRLAHVRAAIPSLRPREQPPPAAPTPLQPHHLGPQSPPQSRTGTSETRQQGPAPRRLLAGAQVTLGEVLGGAGVGKGKSERRGGGRGRGRADLQRRALEGQRVSAKCVGLGWGKADRPEGGCGCP